MACSMMVSSGSCEASSIHAPYRFLSFSKLSILSQHKLLQSRQANLYLKVQATHHSTACVTENEKFLANLKLDDNEAQSRKLTIKDICKSMISEHILRRAEQLGFVYPTEVQSQALPALLSGHDCILHSQTGSGKTLCYLFAILAHINPTKAAVQAIVVVPTRELGMQVVREARKLAKGHDGLEDDKNGASLNTGTLSVMTLLDGGSLSRQKSWLKADPPAIVVGTLPCICKMIETKNLKTHAVRTLVIDEVDAMFGITQHIGLLKSLLQIFANRQTVFASATIPQHTQFIRKCISEKWLKEDVVHVQANQVNKMPPHVLHRHVICERDQKLEMLRSVLGADKPIAAIIFVNEQSEAAKRRCVLPEIDAVAEFLAAMPLQDTDEKYGDYEPLVLREDSHINARTSILADFPHVKRLLIATDLAGRGLDIPEVTHVYNFDLPPTAAAYVHRGGRSARKPLDASPGTVTTILTSQELFVFQRYQNEIMFQSSQMETRG